MVMFFQEPGSLLLEFSKGLMSWIHNVDFGGNTNFYYASMGFEEEEIVSFDYKKDIGTYKLGSVRGSGDINASKSNLVNSPKLFINELNVSVDKKLTRK